MIFHLQVCCEEVSIERTIKLALSHEKLWCSFGMHPHEAKHYSDEIEQKLLNAFKKCGQKAVAWGECGLDFCKNISPKEKQIPVSLS